MGDASTTGWAAAPRIRFITMPIILIVNNDATLLNHLEMQLQEADYTVVRATNIASAERAAREQQPDMALVDPATGGDDGWGLIATLAPHMPVIVVSERGLEEDVVRGLDAGAVDYLSLPYRAGELLARLRVHLRPAASHWTPEPIVDVPLVAPVSMVPAELPPVHTPANAADSRPRSATERLGERTARRTKDEEPVFISFGEEQRIMQEQDRAPLQERPEDDENLPLGQRLRAARQRRRITLVQAELESKLRMHYIQAIEEEKFSLLPRGPLSDDILKRYIAYLGVAESPVLEEYRRLHYSLPIDPPRDLGGRPAPRQLPRWAIWAAAIVLALLIGGGLIGVIGRVNPAFGTTLADNALALVRPPTATPTPTATPVPTSTPAPTATPTATPTSTPTNTPVPTATSTPLPTETPVPTATPRKRK